MKPNNITDLLVVTFISAIPVVYLIVNVHILFAILVAPHYLWYSKNYERIRRQS